MKDTFTSLRPSSNPARNARRYSRMHGVRYASTLAVCPRGTARAIGTSADDREICSKPISAASAPAASSCSRKVYEWSNTTARDRTPAFSNARRRGLSASTSTARSHQNLLPGDPDANVRAARDESVGVLVVGEHPNAFANLHHLLVQARGFFDLEVEYVGSGLVSDGEEIFEAFGDEERGSGAVALEERVGGDGGAADPLDARGGHRGVPGDALTGHLLEDAADALARRALVVGGVLGQKLERAERTGRVGGGGREPPRTRP